MNHLLEYDGPDEGESARLAEAYMQGRISFREYSRRHRELNPPTLAGSTAFVLFMATILPAVDWVRAVVGRLHRVVRNTRQRHPISW